MQKCKINQLYLTKVLSTTGLFLQSSTVWNSVRPLYLNLLPSDNKCLAKRNNMESFTKHKYKNFKSIITIKKWRLPSLSDLTTYQISLGLTH